jgi:2-C-methyl-D-erythritol 4-phosphate cytidylyltransferase
MVHTLQVFMYEILTNSYNQPYTDLFTDDASVVETAGHAITLIEGNKENIKLTTPDDLVYAEMLMAKEK